MREDMQRLGLSLSALARAVEVPPATLRSYLDATSGWPLGVLRAVDFELNRNFEAELVRLGYLASSLTQQYLQQGDAVRRLEERVRRAAELLNSTSLAGGEAVGGGSPGADLVGLMLTPRDPGSPAALLPQGARVVPLVRGVDEPRLHSDLVIVPGQDPADREGNTAWLLRQGIKPWSDRPTADIGDALDHFGAFPEGSRDYLDELAEEFHFAPHDIAIIVPRLLATRFPTRKASSTPGPSTVLVTSLHFGGAADVAALLADERSFGFAAISRLVRASWDKGASAYTPYGGLDPVADSAESRNYHRLARDLSALMLDASLSGNWRCTALDEPEDAIRALERLAQEPPVLAQDSALAVIVMTETRMRWAARRRALGRPTSDPQRLRDPYGDAVEQDFQRMRVLQDQLRQTVENVSDRPAQVFELPDSAKINYEDLDRATAKPDFDCFVRVQHAVSAWLLGL